MSPFEVLLFLTAVQWSAGAVVLINVVLSRLEADAAITGEAVRPKNPSLDLRTARTLAGPPARRPSRV